MSTTGQFETVREMAAEGITAENRVCPYFLFDPGSFNSCGSMAGAV
jgi:hypothetical protein